MFSRYYSRLPVASSQGIIMESWECLSISNKTVKLSTIRILNFVKMEIMYEDSNPNSYSYRNFISSVDDDNDDTEQQQSPNNLFGQCSQEDQETPMNEDNSDNDFFEERNQGNFPGIFAMKNMITRTGSMKLQDDANIPPTIATLVKKETPGSTIFRFSDLTTELNPTKRQKSEKKPSPNDIAHVPSTPSSSGLASSNVLNIFNDRVDCMPTEIEYSRLATDFDMVEIIGTGSFGTVYQARGKLDNVLYAVKRSHARFRGTIDRQRMMHEVHALAAISSSEDADKTMTIVRYFGAWVENDRVCIQMELCDTCVDGLAFESETAIFDLLRDVLLALDLLHSRDFVHLDIKPANILKKGQHYKLGDFGLALHTEHGAGSGVDEGDSRYMARELLNWGVIADITKCDMFSLGITVFHLASGQVPPSEGPEWQSLRNGINPDMEELKGLSPDLVHIIQRLMAPVAADRPSAKVCATEFPVLTTKVLKLERELETKSLELKEQSVELTFYKEQAFSLKSKLDTKGMRKLKRYASVSDVHLG
eukprot:gene2940-5778_t